MKRMLTLSFDTDKIGYTTILYDDLYENIQRRETTGYKLIEGQQTDDTDSNAKHKESQKFKNPVPAYCPFEQTKEKLPGKITIEHPIKCIAKTHPIYQEFRLWHFISNIKIFENKHSEDNTLSNGTDVTNKFLTPAKKAKIFEKLNRCEFIDSQNTIFKIINIKARDYKNYHWNYPDKKKYPCNETHGKILNFWLKSGLTDETLTDKLIEELWTLLFSYIAKSERISILSSFAKRHNLPNKRKFIETFVGFPQFTKANGGYSKEAIIRLLPLMRTGKYWSYENIDNRTQQRIEKILSGESDININDRVRDKAKHLKRKTDFSGLSQWLASYVVYGRHSEAHNIEKLEKPEDIEIYLQSFKNHSFRNPIIGQAISETLHIVSEIWRQYGKIDEIHIKFVNNMRKSITEKGELYRRNMENAKTNLRIRNLLNRLKDQSFGISNVISNSHIQQEKLRIYEETAFLTTPEISKHDTEKLNELASVYDIKQRLTESNAENRPTSDEIRLYISWLERHYQSPYTGKPIPVSKLFTSDYQIDHIIPKALFFDDSYANKVICEANVNNEKGKQLAYCFIKSNSGGYLSDRTTKIRTLRNYENHIKKTFTTNTAKLSNLLADKIPKSFTESQLNDTSYISRILTELLSGIVCVKTERFKLQKQN